MIVKAVDGNIERNTLNQFDQLLAKYVTYFKLFSIDNHLKQLPELLGHALWTGWHLGQESKTIEYEFEKWLEDLKKEFDRKKFGNYYT